MACIENSLNDFRALNEIIKNGSNFLNLKKTKSYFFVLFIIFLVSRKRR